MEISLPPATFPQLPAPPPGACPRAGGAPTGAGPGGSSPSAGGAPTGGTAHVVRTRKVGWGAQRGKPSENGDQSNKTVTQP